MERLIEDVYEFNEKIIGTKQPSVPTTLSRERLLFALTAMYEELHEFTLASNQDNVAEQVDAMIDLIYFALGRCYEIGVSKEAFLACWNIVQQKNMAKKRGTKNRGTEQDACKPQGWVAPNLEEVLN